LKSEKNEQGNLRKLLIRMLSPRKIVKIGFLLWYTFPTYQS